MLRDLVQDLRVSLRALIRAPLFTAVCVLVLGLGIGANTAVFSVIETVLLRPLTYPDADRLMLIHETSPQIGVIGLALPNYLDWRAAQTALTDISTARRVSFNLSFPREDGTEPERVIGAQVSANFIPILGLPPHLGRNFTAAEDTPGGPKAAIIADSLWRRRFGADPHVIGQRIVVDGITREIVGVLPPSIRSPRQAELYVPLGDLRSDPDLLRRDAHTGFAAWGRLKPGVTLAQANDNLNAIARQLARSYPDTNTGAGVDIRRMIDASVGEYRPTFYLLLGAVGCVLLIACANVANLQLARATGRGKELAVRAALGASRARLVRQLLTESATLGALGGAVGVLLALWATDAMISVAPSDIPRFEDLRLDWQSLVFAGVIALVSGLLVGAWPAWRMTRTGAMSTALHDAAGRGASAGSAQGRARAWLVVVQLALTLVLLAGAGLTLKSFWRTQTEPFGFQRDGVLTMALSLPEARYNAEKVARFYDELLERVRALPGVEEAASVVNIPFGGEGWTEDVHITGTPPAVPGQEQSAQLTLASPGYFKAMGIPVLRGRAFGPEDRAGQPGTIIVDEKFARRYFPDSDPLGRQVDNVHPTGEGERPPMTIVGVVGRTRNDPPGDSLYLDNLPQAYICTAQMSRAKRTLVVRVRSGDPLQLAEPVRRAVLSLDPDVPVSHVATMEQNIAAMFSSQRLTMILLGSFATLALLLASLGLYGVMALGVAQRTRELGIRLALGAQRSGVLRLVLGQSARLVGVGLALGLAAALGAGRLLAGIVYGVSGLDVQILLLVSMLLAAVALLASYLPARRATRIDPLTALREE
jgi:putative ABC transport system permease protein